MHEMALMSGVFQIIEDTLKKHPEVEKVVLVRLEVGKLTNAVPDALEMAFQAFSKGTKAEDAKLEIDIVPLTLACTICGHVSTYEEACFKCASCGDIKVDVLRGRELRVDSLEVE